MGDDFRVHPWHGCIKVTVPRVSVLGSMQDMGSHSLPLCRHAFRSVGDRWGVPTVCVYVGKYVSRQGIDGGCGFPQLACGFPQLAWREEGQDCEVCIFSETICPKTRKDLVP